MNLTKEAIIADLKGLIAAYTARFENIDYFVYAVSQPGSDENTAIKAALSKYAKYTDADLSDVLYLAVKEMDHFATLNLKLMGHSKEMTLNLEPAPLQVKQVDSTKGALYVWLSKYDYESSKMDLANPIKYIEEHLRVECCDVDGKQLIEALEAARVSEINTAANAKSATKARRFSMDEKIEALSLVEQLPATKKGKQERIKELTTQVKEDKGEYYATTQFLKKEHVRTAAFYGDDFMDRLCGLTDSFFASR